MSPFLTQLAESWTRSDSLVCVGLDPELERFPGAVTSHPSPIFQFNKAIIDATADLVCAYKPQFAHYAAYEAEIYRGAILAVPRGQSEAAHALGLSGPQTLRHVIVPQALRIALPPMTNDFIALLKDSSIVGVISVVELTKRMSIAAVDLRSWVLPGLLCAALYFAMSFPLSRLATWLEARLGHGVHR